MTDFYPVRRALLSVSDKTGLLPFAKGLVERGVELLSTGGTATALREAGLPVRDVSEATNFPEILGGRVKTLHPHIHGGILAKRTPQHLGALAVHHIGTIDLVVVNLYPFAQTRHSGAGWDECVEEIDIGGVALLRAAAKNHAYVTVVSDPADYPEVLSAVQAHGAVTAALRLAGAAKAFAHTAQYDAVIAEAFAQHQGAAFPAAVSLPLQLVQPLRYGANPHQRGAFYADASLPPYGLAAAQQVQGKELSYNNINDADAAWQLVNEFDHPAVAIIKHANPCGVAVGEDVVAAYKAALRCDPVSAFGGIVAVNRVLDEVAAQLIGDVFSEVVLAPSFTEDALAVFAAKKNLRLLDMSGAGGVPFGARTVRGVSGGFLLQTADQQVLGETAPRCVTVRKPSSKEEADLLFAFTVAKHVKSNAIIYVKDGATLAIGAGQMSRVDAARIAARKAEDAGLSLEDSVVASDAFFPFADGLLVAIEAGARAVIQPGGSIRDNEVIAAADAAHVAMIFTGIRHFRH
ncbi:MAG: bifunctional phosphoribosylaminoimidazolecarboxamide formyltransferase/IMP cyclohydrolase [Holosporales bacterium]